MFNDNETLYLVSGENFSDTPIIEEIFKRTKTSDDLEKYMLTYGLLRKELDPKINKGIKLETFLESADWIMEVFNEFDMHKSSLLSYFNKKGISVLDNEVNELVRYNLSTYVINILMITETKNLN